MCIRDSDRIILAGNLGANPWQAITGMESRGATDMNEEFKNMAQWMTPFGIMRLY